MSSSGLTDQPAVAVVPPFIGDLTQIWPHQAPPQNGPSEFQLNLGHAIDTLRVDHPRLFTHKPDLSIFAPDMEVHDPSGKRLQGVKQYAHVFGMLRFLRRTAMQDAQLTHRLVVNGKEIRMRWSAKLWMRDPSLGVITEPILMYIDGVSVYELNDKGLIRKHRLENIVLRNSGAECEARQINLDFAWPRAGLATPELAMPFFRALHAALPPQAADAKVEPARESSTSFPLQPVPARRAPAPQASLDAETPMERAAREREEMAQEERRRTQQRQPKQSQKQTGGFLNGLFKGSVQACESSYDCDAPMVCCDLLFTSICCDGGMMIPTRPDPILQPQLIPIPVERDPLPGMPRNIPPQQQFP